MEKKHIKDVEAEPFLEPREQGSYSKRHDTPDRDGSSTSYLFFNSLISSFPSLRACIFHIALIFLYTFTWILALNRQRQDTILLHDTIQNLNVRIMPTEYMTAGLSPFAGGPTEQVDSAWHRLLANISIRVTDEELSRNGNRRESVALPEGGGQMVWLGVFHQLHCLKKLRQLNYPQSYTPNLTKDEAKDQEVHINHCIELLRQSAMCNPDTSLTTFSWSHTKPKPVLNIGSFERKCVDWEAFMVSVLPRVVSSQEVDGLVNPNLAAAYS